MEPFDATAAVIANTSLLLLSLLASPLSAGAVAGRGIVTSWSAAVTASTAVVSCCCVIPVSWVDSWHAGLPAADLVTDAYGR